MTSPKLPVRLHWVKEAFHRTIEFKNGDQTVGWMRKVPFGFDVEAELNNVHLRFDVRGFINKIVQITDQKTNQIAGTIQVSWRKNAELTLPSGETYRWERKNFLMREWSMIYDLPYTDNDPEVVNYARTRAFFADEGDIEILKQSPQGEIVVLTGLFVRNYFLRRRRAAAVIAATG